MNIKQQVVQERVEKTAKMLNTSEDLAFLRYVHSLIADTSMHSFNDADLVEGGQEKQIDIITFEQDDEEAVVYIIQAKNTGSFSSNALIQMRNGLKWIFNKPKKDIEKLSNKKLKDKILEFRTIQSAIGPSNIEIIVRFASNGLESEISEEFKQEMKTILEQYDNGTYAMFDFKPWGAESIVDCINLLEKKNRKVNADIYIRYDTNNPSLIKYHSEELKGLVCTVSTREIARIVNEDKLDAIFDANIRRFLGSRGAVNADIKTTCTSNAMSHQFWFLNNGITIICDNFDPVTDPDNPHVKIQNMQIVNGCQTAKTLALAEKENKLSKNSRVLLRIYETKDRDLVDKIVLTTNNQNKITSRDLRANSSEQVDMQRGFEKYKYYYERKVKQYDDVSNIDATRIMDNETVARSYLSIVLKTPSDASRRKYKVWGELYAKIFNGKCEIEIYILAAQIYKYVSGWLKTSGYCESRDDIVRKIANNGSFHIARIAASLWWECDNWQGNISEIKDRIKIMESNVSQINPYIRKAFTLLKNTINKNQQYKTDINSALKLVSLDADITRSLHLKFGKLATRK